VTERTRELTLARTRAGGADFRDALGGMLPDRASGLLDRSILLLSELFSRDTGLAGVAEGEVAVRVGAGDGTVRIEVRDAGSGYVMDVLRQPSATGRPGWSPHLLSTVADRWGLVSGEGGAWVWFELDYPQEDPA
jgi:hypothetical protein